MLTLEEVKKKVYSLGSQIGIDCNFSMYPIFSETPDVYSDGISVYIDGLDYHYIVMERGIISKDYLSKDYNDILYCIFSNITFAIAKKYELENRKGDEDFRRLLWMKQLELLKNIDDNFVIIREKEIQKILKISPFRDEQ